RYHWVVLPQGMKNSPTICQWFLARVLSPIRQKMPDALLYHYMDDILIAAEKQEGRPGLNQTRHTPTVTQVGLCVAPEKIQHQPPWKYLGWRIRTQTISPQPLPIQSDIRTLHDAQKILGTINWVRPLGIFNVDLGPLFAFLKGEPNLLSPRQLT
ncbi:hypothetical protein N302_00928, partial [Corvus brachyrhynchos]